MLRQANMNVKNMVRGNMNEINNLTIETQQEALKKEHFNSSRILVQSPNTGITT